MAVAAGGRANLPDDLIREILLQLPVRALTKFKLVSKKWLALITSHNFISQQHSVAKFQLCAKRSASFFVFRIPMNFYCQSFVTRIFVGVNISNDGSGAQEEDKVDEHTYLPLPPLEFTKIPSAWPYGHWGRHVYRPLFFFPAGFGVYCIFQSRPWHAALWNAATGETKVLPPSPFYDGRKKHFSGFGYIECNKDDNFSYKVGRISSHPSSHEYLSLELYSSSTNSWKLMPSIYTRRLSSTRNWFHNGANLNGRFHWLMWCAQEEEEEEDPYINSFDYYTEVFSRIDIPVVAEFGRYGMRSSILTLYDDKFLCLVLCWTNKCNMQFLDVWSMHEYGVKESWTKEYTVGPIPKDMEVLGFCNNVRAIFLRGGGNILLRTRFYLCDCVSSKIKRFRKVGSNEGEFMQIMEYVESLVSIKVMADQTSN